MQNNSAVLVNFDLSCSLPRFETSILQMFLAFELWIILAFGEKMSFCKKNLRGAFAPEVISNSEEIALQFQNHRIQGRAQF
jgi:hypothetical protein